MVFNMLYNTQIHLYNYFGTAPELARKLNLFPPGEVGIEPVSVKSSTIKGDPGLIEFSAVFPLSLIMRLHILYLILVQLFSSFLFIVSTLQFLYLGI